MWTVTRQHQWLDGDKVVEISSGGIDYTNPDALAAKYPGEFEEFDDPREAVNTAIAIAQAWQADAPDDEILIDTGATGGSTMPFDGQELTEETIAGLREWADKKWNALPKCDRCGDTITGEPLEMADDWVGDRKFCSESCVEAQWGEESQPLEEEDEADERAFYYASRYHAASRMVEACTSGIAEKTQA